MAEKKLGSFEALKTGMFTGGIVYEAYISDLRLVAVKVGGQMDGGKAITMHFGLLGALIHYFLLKRVNRKRAALRASNEALPLDELLQQDPSNFEVRFDALEKAELKKAGMLKAGHANLVLTPLGQEAVQLTLQTKALFARALPVLESGLKARLETDPKLRA